MIITKKDIFMKKHPECENMTKKELRLFIKKCCSVCSICPITEDGYADCNIFDIPDIQFYKNGKRKDSKPKDCPDLVGEWFKKEEA